jgi:hypothetical protein
MKGREYSRNEVWKREGRGGGLQCEASRCEAAAGELTGAEEKGRSAGVRAAAGDSLLTVNDHLSFSFFGTYIKM